MKITILPWIFVSLLVVLTVPRIASGQEKPNCPNLEVIPPPGIINVKEPATFVLRTDQDFPEAYKYEWTVNDATIVKGQGTRVIEILAHLYGSGVRATVTVKGLPAHCANTASEIVGVEPRMEWHATDEWGEIPNNDQRGRLDMFFVELSNNPTHIGLVFIDAKNKVTERRRLKLVLDHAHFRKFDKNLFMFCLGRSDWNQTRVYRLPPQLVPDISEMGCKPVPGALLK